MSTIAKVLIAAALAVAGGVGGGVTLAQAGTGSDDPAGEVRGPCDEAEHANDSRCPSAATGAQRREDRGEANDDRQRRRHRGSHRDKSSDSSSDGRRDRSSSGRR